MHRAAVSDARTWLSPMSLICRILNAIRRFVLLSAVVASAFNGDSNVGDQHGRNLMSMAGGKFHAAEMHGGVSTTPRTLTAHP
eukprot:6182790-Pleurochrysis_carterae.AAC.4